MAKTNPTRSPASESTAGLRRTRYGAMTAILITAAAAIALFIGVIGERTATRFDLTSTRSYTLSSRTTQLLSDLDMPIEVAAVVNLGPQGQADARSVQRIRDLMNEYTRRSDNISFTLIDTASADSRPDFNRVVALMASYAEDDIAQHRETLERTVTGLERTERDLRRLADRTQDTAQAASEFVGGQIEAFILTMQSMADECVDAREKVQTALENEVAGTAMPATDEAQLAASQLLTNASSAFSDISNWARQISVAPQIENDTLKASAASLSAASGEAASQSAATLDRLIRLQPLEPLQVARAIQQTEAVLVISPSGTTAIKFDAIFPLRTNVEQGQSIAQVSFAGEELISTAISTLSMDDPPIVAIVHGEPGRIFDDTGRPSASTSGDTSSPHSRLGVSINQLAQRLRMRRIDVVEWAVATDQTRPNFLDINPDRTRPVVWFVVGEPTRIGLDPSRGSSLSERAERLRRLATAVDQLYEAGEDILMAVEPSELPAIGDNPPLTDRLTELGITVDAGRPLIRHVPTAQGDAWTTFFEFTSAAPGSPISEPLMGLTGAMTWATPIIIDETKAAEAGATVHPLYEVPASESTWAEAEWLRFRYAFDQNPLGAISMRTAPSRSESRDDLEGPWTVAATVERTLPDAGGRADVQRIVIVSAPNWFQDPYLFSQLAVDGRTVTRFAANAELIDASLFWLADMDELIARSARVSDVSRIRALTPGQRTAIRWSMIAGLPVLVLLVGAGLRIWRG